MRFVRLCLIGYHQYRLHRPSPIIFDSQGRVRSGWRAALFLFAFIGVTLGTGVSEKLVLAALRIDLRPGSLELLTINSLLSFLAAWWLGAAAGKLLEKLPFRALGLGLSRGWLTHFVFGCLAGAATLSIAVLLIWIFGGEGFEFDAVKGSTAVVSSLAVSFVVFGVAAAFEEALFRGYLLQTFSRSGLAWLAIAGTSVFFGLVHLGNPNATAISTANTVIAGIWFSIAYLKTRDLWFVWGLHLMWNWMQGSFFGIEVSGLTEITSAPLLREIDRGPIWLTGNDYGIEGGIVCTIALILSSAAIWFMPVPKPDPEMEALTSPLPGTQAPSPAAPAPPA